MHRRERERERIDAIDNPKIIQTVQRFHHQMHYSRGHIRAPMNRFPPCLVPPLETTRENIHLLSPHISSPCARPTTLIIQPTNEMNAEKIGKFSERRPI
jgi:hypothetical protein